MAKRACKSQTKAGTPCKAAPLKGKDYCSAHDPETPASTRFGSPEQAHAAGVLGGRPPKPNPNALSLMLMEDNPIALEAPYWRALGFDIVEGEGGNLALKPRASGGAKVVHRGWDGERAVTEVSDVDDLAAQIAAAEKLKDRAYGRARQAVEVTGSGGGPIRSESTVDLSKLSTDDLEQLDALLARGQTDQEQ